MTTNPTLSSASPGDALITRSQPAATSQSSLPLPSAQPQDASSTTAPAHDSPPPINTKNLDPNTLLERPYLYQSHETGSASTSPLTIRQLCRILCPRKGVMMNRIRPTTMIIGYDPLTGAYSKEGWIMAENVPVLREACSAWYYEGTDKGKVEGPVSCRELANLLQMSVMTERTRVWSAEITQEGGADDSGDVSFNGEEQQRQRQRQQQWKFISELPNLMAAIQSFDATVAPWTFNGSDGTKSEGDLNTPAGTNTDITCDKQQQQPQYDPSVMTFVDEREKAPSSGRRLNPELASSTASTTGTPSEVLDERVQEELEAFLSSTSDMGGPSHHINGDHDGDDDDDQEGYESDGGTQYIKDPSSGNYIHAALAPPSSFRQKQLQQQGQSGATQKSTSNSTPKAGNSNNNNNNNIRTNPKKRKKKPKFAAKNAKNWIYVTGLPLDTTEEEVIKYFSKVGIIDLDPETQHPKVKLYRHGGGTTTSSSDGTVSKNGALKGDASVCYARPESVELAIQLLDESIFRPSLTTTTTSEATTTAAAATAAAETTTKTTTLTGKPIRVERAKFEQHGDKFEEKRLKQVSNAKRKVAKLAALQAMDWDEDGDHGRISGGRKGLRIIVLKGMFHPHTDFTDEDVENKILKRLEEEVRNQCEEWGTVEKITIFAKNPMGVMVIKFTQPVAASTAVSEYNGRVRNGRRIEASFWDGVTDYTVRDEEREEQQEKKRLDEFGNWLENQDLPEELQLKVESEDVSSESKETTTTS